MREYGLPQPQSNGFVEGMEVDLHWPEHRLIVEIDGHATHDHRRAFETDRVRPAAPRGRLANDARDRLADDRPARGDRRAVRRTAAAAGLGAP